MWSCLEERKKKMQKSINFGFLKLILQSDGAAFTKPDKKQKHHKPSLRLFI